MDQVSISSNSALTTSTQYLPQDSFRLLLKSGSSSNTPAGSRRNFSSASAKSKKADSSQPAFKPRKVKKPTTESNYRDRATERREGGGNDYAHVEAIRDDFERRIANSGDQTDVEEKRKYLGGDGEHSILVKGLDMALLEQNKARAAQEQMADDDSLEQAYLDASSSTNVTKKRTRQDIIKELKQKRSRQGEPDTSTAPEASAAEKEKSLEDVKKQGKFKPIGFKPIGVPEEGKKRKKAKNGESTKEGGERKKKKRKVENSEAEASKTPIPTPASVTKEPPAVVTNPSATKTIEPEPEPLGEDFDIFAGAGDYEGLEVDDEEDEDETEPPVKPTSQEPISAGPPRKWIETEDDVPSKPFPSSPEANDPKRIPLPSENRGRVADGHDVQMEGGEVQETQDEEQRPMRLEALESSNLPSIRDFLAMDDAALAAEKRKKRKEKKKSGGGPKNMEAKVNRDFQRLQSYTSKKEGSGS